MCSSQMDVHNAFPAFQRLKMFTLSHSDAEQSSDAGDAGTSNRARSTGAVRFDRRFPPLTFASPLSERLQGTTNLSLKKREVRYRNLQKFDWKNSNCRLWTLDPRRVFSEDTETAETTMVVVTSIWQLSPYDRHNVIQSHDCFNKMQNSVNHRLMAH